MFSPSPGLPWKIGNPESQFPASAKTVQISGVIFYALGPSISELGEVSELPPPPPMTYCSNEVFLLLPCTLNFADMKKSPEKMYQLYILNFTDATSLHP